jgi:hypothetical protein
MVKPLPELATIKKTRYVAKPKRYYRNYGCLQNLMVIA